jgi:Spy/CpxP family protein refolding chaperone
MKTKSLLMTALILVAVATAFAQGGRTPPSPTDIANHHVKMLTTVLSLTSAQQQQATAIYTNSAKAEQTIREAEKGNRENLRTAVKNNDSASIDQIAGTMAQSNAQLTSIHAKADAAFYQILTPDQQSKFNELESEHMGFMGGPGRGPGGMEFH